MWTDHDLHGADQARVRLGEPRLEHQVVQERRLHGKQHDQPERRAERVVAPWRRPNRRHRVHRNRRGRSDSVAAVRRNIRDQRR